MNCFHYVLIFRYRALCQDHLRKEKHIDEDIDYTRDVTEQIL